ncbi:GAF domain-containing sensor histidine kinase [Ensifer sp. HO-A22]|uniref:histidine kinase n=1 Tax=Ensifer oleiphilus TaxID=2742698 RepID=A0A7Y6QAI0_9HYPH|nr:GAF domain-containing sensor histidine kinase [Ensifer oleiphilus]NVD42064.1 GAF domain-containing sensor histidine kinase [Ensifer oleiphilus]
MAHDFQADLDAVASISVVPTILDVIQQSTGMRFVAIARVTQDRWIACQTLDLIDFGLAPGGELQLETTICHEIRQSGELVVIDDVSASEAYANHHTPLQYGLKSYISVPIYLRDNVFFGTLCAIDPSPAKLGGAANVGMFRLFADLIARHLDARADIADAKLKLDREIETSELRDQFIAILGHDLRNPLASISAGTRILAREEHAPKSSAVISLMQQSVDRMANLIDNVMDFARGRLGGGIGLNRTNRLLTPVLTQIVAEHRSIYPDRQIETDLVLEEPLTLDHQRIGQLFSNLLGNALTHGAADKTIRVGAARRSGTLELWVANRGEPIAETDLPRLFQPFKRREGKGKLQGLGLGLYIAAEIAQAHGGRISVSSTSEETRFTLNVPVC